MKSKSENRLTTDGANTLLNGELDWVYPEELDLNTAYWWSPDSQSIAYMQFDVSREPDRAILYTRNGTYFPPQSQIRLPSGV